jgi:lipooligosaccharide transport system permease protein
VLSGFKWQRIYFAMTAGPITPGQVALAQIGWVAAKITGSGIVYLAVIAVFGGIISAGIVVSLLAAVLAGAAVASLITAFAATVENEGTAFNAIFRFVIIPMTLFSGTFYPIQSLPAWAQPLAVVSPLWHGTEIARSAALGRWELLPTLGHAAFLAMLLAVGLVLSVRMFARRLAQ